MTQLRLLKNHEFTLNLGTLTKDNLELKDDGLYFNLPTAKMPQTTLVKDTLTEIEAGIHLGISPGVEHIKGGHRKVDGVWNILKSSMYEMSIATIPVFENSSIGVLSDSPSHRRRVWYL